MFFYTKEMEICPAYISKYNSSCEKHYHLMIRNEKGWHYLSVNTIRITNTNNLKEIMVVFIV